MENDSTDSIVTHIPRAKRLFTLIIWKDLDNEILISKCFELIIKAAIVVFMINRLTIWTMVIPTLHSL